MTRNNLRVIGVTGNTGSGKTTVAALLAERGGLVIDADVLAHDVIKKGRPAYFDIIEIFGGCVLTPEGEIDRKKLGVKVFNDKAALTELEQIVHPRVCEAAYDIMENAAPGDAEFIVIDAVLLVEAGIHKHCDKVWLVTAPPELKTARIIRRDGLTAGEAARRMRSQRDEALLIPYADAVINNGGTLETLKEQLKSLLGKG